MSQSASKEMMQALHKLLAEEFTKMLVEGVPTVVEGEVIKLPPSSAQLNVIRQFLKDNDIQAMMTSVHMKGIVDNLPFDENDLPPNAVRLHS